MFSQLTAVAIVFYFLCAPLAEACAPLVVYVGGLSGEKNKRMKSLHQSEKERYKTEGVQIITQYFSWLDHAGIVYAIVEHTNYARRARIRSPIVVVGYSYGGDTAYHALEDLKSRDFRIAPLLVTLDPVGERAWWSCSDWRLIISWCTIVDWQKRDRELKKPTAGRWLNVWIQNGRNFVGLGKNAPFSQGEMERLAALGHCNRIADLGGVYGRQLRARNFRYTGNHCGIKGMFRLVRKHIDEHILSSCR